MPFPVRRVSEVTIEPEILQLLRKILFFNEMKKQNTHDLLRRARSLRSPNPYSGAHIAGSFPSPLRATGRVEATVIFKRKTRSYLVQSFLCLFIFKGSVEDRVVTISP